MRFSATIVILMLVAGCGNKADDAARQGENVAFDPAVLQQKPTATSIAGVDFGKRIAAFGTEPYWLLAIEPGKLEFEDYGVKNGVKVAWTAAAPKLTGNVAMIETKTPEGEVVKITLRGESCLEVGSEANALPLRAEVKIGERTLTGCAGQKLAGPESAEADNAISATADNAGI